ncbi:MAG: hypothetical protein WBG41_13155 [Acidimicrobiales bacterium]
MSQSVDEVKEAIKELIEANRALRSQLLVNEGILTEAIRSLDAGVGVGRTLMTVPSVHDRRAAEDAVRSLYEARHEVRKAVIPAAMRDGLELVDIANAFGVPLDAITGYANQAPVQH